MEGKGAARSKGFSERQCRKVKRQFQVPRLCRAHVSASDPLMPFFLPVAESAELGEAIAQLPMEWAFWSVRHGREKGCGTCTKCAACNSPEEKPAFMRVVGA